MDRGSAAWYDKAKFDICFNDVEFQYGDNKVINGVSFTANQNAVTAIVGPSGCGKTTVLRCCFSSI